MNKLNHLLLILSEECVELSKECHKALRFGLNDKEPGQDLTNKEKIINEYNDLVAIINMLNENYYFEDELVTSSDLINKKIEKVLKFMDYSESVGTLNNE